MEEGNVSESSLTSAAAFVEGGIQEACDDACSICLEAFCDSDPSTVTSCKHEFHLHCILEWCQRSSQCPMCWQPISFKDPSSQELLDAVENERNIRMNPPRNTTIFHHPTLGDFELQHLPVSAGESELEERIIQHLAAAAAMGRARQIARREGQRNRSSGQGRPHFLVFSTQPNGTGSVTSPLISVAEHSTQLIGRSSSAQADQLTATASGSSATGTEHGTPSRSSQDRAGPSDSQSLSETLKSRFSALSTRYKDSITKSTKGWKERLFARNSSIPEPPSIGARGEVEQGTTAATVSRMMDHLHIAEERTSTISNNFEGHSTPEPTEQQTIERGTDPSSSEDETRTPLATSTTSASS